MSATSCVSPRPGPSSESQHDDLMSTTIDNLQKLSQELRQRHNKDSDPLREVKNKVEELEEEKYAAALKIASLEKDIAEQSRLCDALRDENEDGESRIQDLEDELSECVESNRQKDAESREIRQKLEKLGEQFKKDTQEQEKKMKKAMKKTEKAKESLVTVNEAKTQRMKEITAQLLKANSDAETMKKEKSQHKRSMFLAQRRIKTLEGSLQRANARREEWEQLYLWKILQQQVSSSRSGARRESRSRSPRSHSGSPRPRSRSNSRSPGPRSPSPPLLHVRSRPRPFN